MKKSLLIIMTVAILGGLGLYINKSNDQAAMADTSTAASQPANSTAASAATTDTAQSSATYKDGTYVGSQANTLYGTVQVSAIISGGKITDVQFLKMPNDQENSKVVTAMAEPQLKSQTLSKQSAHIDFVSGATQSSQGFEQSLQNALNQAT